MTRTRIIVLDLDDARVKLDEEHWRPHLPPDAEALAPLHLSAFGAPLVRRHGPDARPVDWPGIQAALQRLSRALDAQANGPMAPRAALVIGVAPLPVFTSVGYDLQPWQGPVTFVNYRREDDVWDVASLAGSKELAAVFPFATSGLPDAVCEATGLVALTLWTRHRPVEAAVRAYCQALGEPLAAMVELRPPQGGGELLLTGANAAGTSAQVRQTLDLIHNRFPHRSGLALIVSGPAMLAFIAGREINPRVHPRVHVANYEDGRYEHALTLQPGGQRAPRVPAPAQRVKLLLLNSRAPADNTIAPEIEAREIEQCVRAAPQREHWDCAHGLAALPADVAPLLNRERPDIVHFGGHGAWFGVSLCGDDGRQRTVDQRALGPLFESLATPVRLVVLNGCNTASLAEALSQVVECAIGMAGEPSEREATAFSIAFHGALASGLAVADAFKQGEAGLRMERRETSVSPRLFVRTGSDAATLRFPGR
jgi:hypothetical protein